MIRYRRPLSGFQARLESPAARLQRIGAAWLARSLPRVLNACHALILTLLEPFLRVGYRALAAYAWNEADRLRAQLDIALLNEAESRAAYERFAAERRGVEEAIRVNERTGTKAEVRMRA